MKNILMAMAIAMVAAMAGHAESRTWKSTNGQEIAGELKEFDAATGKVTLKRADGQVFTFSQDRLSEEDRTYLAEVEKKKVEAKAAADKEVAGLAGNVKNYVTTGPAAKGYHVYYPKAYSPTRPLPMIILFDPGGGGGGILNAFKEAAEKNNWIAVGCDFLKNGQDEKEGEIVFKEMLPEIEKTVKHHDPKRLYMGGFSGGGLRAFFYTAAFERPWKGVLSCGGWLGGAQNYDKKFARNMAVAMVNGDKDSNANMCVEGDSGALKKKRAKTKLFPFPGGHAIGPPAVLSEAMAWMTENTRDNPNEK